MPYINHNDGSTTFLMAGSSDDGVYFVPAPGYGGPLLAVAAETPKPLQKLPLPAVEYLQKRAAFREARRAAAANQTPTPSTTKPATLADQHPMTSRNPAASASVRDALDNINGSRGTASRTATPKTTMPKTFDENLKSIQASEPGISFDAAWDKAFAMTDNTRNTTPNFGSPAAQEVDKLARAAQVRADSLAAISVSKTRALPVKPGAPVKTYPAVVAKIANSNPPLSLAVAESMLAEAQKKDADAQAAYIAATQPNAYTNPERSVIQSETFQQAQERNARNYPHLDFDAVWTLTVKERSTLV